MSTLPEIRLIEVREPSYLFHKIDGYSFKRVQKNGEMALINWIEVWQGDKLFAEFNENNCNIFYET